MFKNIFGPASQPAAEKTERAFTDATAGETETVRRIVGRLNALPPDRARLVASAAYILARAANADMDISDEETKLIEQQLQERGMLDEPTAVLVAEMARLQSRTVGDTEDYVVTREFKAQEHAPGLFHDRCAERRDHGRGSVGHQPDRA